jgi:hypothetical protein
VRASSPFRSISDLKGKRIVWGTVATGLRLLGKDVVDGLGLDPDRDFQPIILEKAADGPKLVLSGEADALWGAGIGWPGFEAIAKAPDGGRFIGPSDAEINQILLKHPYLSEMEIPAGSYTGQDQSIKSVGLWSLILVRADMPEAAAFELAQSLHAAEPALLTALPQTRFATAANAAHHVGRQELHPGVLAFLKKGGFLN